MKLIIRQYVSSLKERDELDALLPDLLSQMGLTVFSRPGRGTRQDGVDVAAIGSINGGPEKVYLFSIKPGDLTRVSWDGDSIQSLRPSLNEIRDSYIPHRLPDQYSQKEIVICICVGGDIQEQVRPAVEGYIKENKKDKVSYEEWNGDKLADFIGKYFLREDLLPEEARPKLRKSLALIDEPDASFRFFSELILSITNQKQKSGKKIIMSIRQIYICLWILYSWSRDVENLESAYLSSERAVLYSWELSKNYFQKKSKIAESIQLAFTAVLNLYHLITNQYLADRIIPHVNKRDALSSAVESSSSLDVNLKIFNVLGRLALAGIWVKWNSFIYKNNDDIQKKIAHEVDSIYWSLKELISNNPTLLLPFKDDQAIDISLALLFLSYDDKNEKDMLGWISEILNRSMFAYETEGHYPCILQSYRDLLDHPKHDTDYREEVTSGSILYPTIALWSALLNNNEILKRVSEFKEKLLSHCNFQLWYPDDISEESLYLNSQTHGKVLSNIPVHLSADKMLKIIWDECEKDEYFQNLSASENGLSPIILIACRHYRLPIPPHFTLGYKKTDNTDDKNSEENVNA